MTLNLHLESGWLVWNVGLDDLELSAVVSAYVSDFDIPDSFDGLLAAVRITEAEALTRDGCGTVGIWAPPAQSQAAGGVMYLSSFIAERAKEASWKRMEKAVRKVPRLPGVVFLAYSSTTRMLDAGPTVIQHMETYQTNVQDLILNTWRFTVFPEAPHDGSEIHVFDFETVFPLLVDDFEEAVIELTYGTQPVPESS